MENPQCFRNNDKTFFLFKALALAFYTFYLSLGLLINIILKESFILHWYPFIKPFSYTHKSPEVLLR